MRKILDAACMETEAEAHRYMKKVLQFPDYYGENLDALYDCLNEYDGLEIGLSNYGEGVEHMDRICHVMEAAGVAVKKI